ncbi:YwqG family protein [Staphylococcus chromogenes]|nr:YwqG family protein [Staphylococcus chromogenes]
MDHIEIAQQIGLEALPRLSYESTFCGNNPTFRQAGLRDSKLGGAPYRPQGAGWPCKGNGEPYSFVAQLNLAQVERDRQTLGVPPLLGGALPTHGLIQFFLPFDEVYGLGYGQPDCFVAYIEDADIPADEPVFAWREAFDAPIQWLREDPEPKFDPRLNHLSCSPWSTEESILRHPEVAQALEPVLLEPTYQLPVPGLHAEVTTEQEAQWNTFFLERPPRSTLLGKVRHQIGGYADFVQNEPRPKGSPLRLLFQIDSDGHMQWIGDMGTMQFFIDPADLARRDFSKVLIDWSCG